MSGTVTFEEVIAALTLEADDTTAETGQSVGLTVTVTDHDGQPFKKQWVTLATSGGPLNVAKVMTDGNGQGTFTLTSASATTATAGSVSDTADVTFEQVILTVSASALDSSGGNANGIVFG